MVDKKGANYSVIKDIFDVDFMTFKVVNCQIHFKNDVIKASLRLGVSFRDEIKTFAKGCVQGQL